MCILEHSGPGSASIISHNTFCTGSSLCVLYTVIDTTYLLAIIAVFLPNAMTLVSMSDSNEAH